MRVRWGGRLNGDPQWWQTLPCSFVEGRWFERHGGRVRVEPQTVLEEVRELDERKDLWGIITITRDLEPAEADGTTASEAATVLLQFDGIQRRFRS